MRNTIGQLYFYSILASSVNYIGYSANWVFIRKDQQWKTWNRWLHVLRKNFVIYCFALFDLFLARNILYSSIFRTDQHNWLVSNCKRFYKVGRKSHSHFRETYTNQAIMASLSPLNSLRDGNDSPWTVLGYIRICIMKKEITRCMSNW